MTAFLKSSGGLTQAAADGGSAAREEPWGMGGMGSERRVIRPYAERSLGHISGWGLLDNRDVWG